MIGLIVKSVAGFYYVKSEERIIECKARGRFRSIGTSPLVGDVVEVSLSGDKGTVEKIYERRNFLDRPPLANIDKLFIISSAVTPIPNLLLIDRMTALCEFKKITPVIVFNKSDMGDLSSYTCKYNSVGYTVIECSAVSGLGIADIIAELRGCTSAFTGNSGVGKTSILNKIFPELELSTGEVSEKLGRGRHTTRHCELFYHCYDGYVADTPGFSSFEYDMNNIEFKEALTSCFPEFADYDGSCRFSDCKHIGEAGCSVDEAVKLGNIDFDRLSSYRAIFNELKDIKPWNIKRTDS